jgi:hypothetical protein
MMNAGIKLQLSLLCVLAATSPSSLAQSSKPGLWEITQKLGGNPEIEAAMARVEKQMASMSPEQKKMMQAMVAKQGVSMGTATGGGTVAKICITKEMADRPRLPSQMQGDCTTTLSDKTASSMKMKFVCKSPASSGEGTYTFASDAAYSMKMKMTIDDKGGPKTMTIDSQGKWLSNDCGDVKPLAVQAK